MTSLIRKLLIPVLALALLWSLLSDGNRASWLVGIPTVLAGSWAALRIRPAGGERPRVSLPGLLAFVPLFVGESIRGGTDVALRVLRPRLRLAPGFVSYRTELRSASARLLFVNSVNLLPGTVAVEIDDDLLRIHALDSGADFSSDLRRLESAVGRICREDPGQ